MLSIPRKKKIIRIIIIIVALVDALLDDNQSNTPEEQCWRLVSQADFLMNSWDSNEANWDSAQDDLAGLIDTIYAAHDPQNISQPVTADYEGWVADLEDKISRL